MRQFGAFSCFWPPASRPRLCRSAQVWGPRATMAAMWELVVFMVLLKIPIAYLCAVVWYAVRATPEPPAGADLVPVVPPEDGSPAPVRPRLRHLDPNPRRHSRGRAPRRPARTA